MWGVRNGVVHRNELSKLAIEQVDKLLRKTGDEMKQANVWIRSVRCRYQLAVKSV